MFRYHTILILRLIDAASQLHWVRITCCYEYVQEPRGMMMLHMRTSNADDSR